MIQDSWSVRIEQAIWASTHIVGQIPTWAAFPVCVLSILWIYPLWRRLASSRTSGLLASGMSLAFWGLDALLLALLPVLKLSYGPVGPSLLAITLLRLALTLGLGLSLWGLSVAWRAPRHAILFLALIHLGLLAAAAHSLYVEPFRVSRTHLCLPGPAFLDRPLRMAHVSDIHVERITRREREVIDRIERFRPDLILLTGDYLNFDFVNDPKARTDARAFLSSLHAPYGVYAVVSTGMDTSDAVEAMVEGTDVRVLRDEVEFIPLPLRPLVLIGLSHVYPPRDALNLPALVAKTRPEDYTVLLYHSPDLMPEASQQGLRLFLAGHTHGGQICLPFYGAMVTSLAHGKRYEAGLYREGKTTLYVSRGLGMEGCGGPPRARFLCPPELALIEVGPPEETR